GYHYQRFPIGFPGRPILLRPRNAAPTPVRSPPRLLPGTLLGRPGRRSLWLYAGRLPQARAPVPPSAFLARGLPSDFPTPTTLRPRTPPRRRTGGRYATAESVRLRYPT